MKTVIMAGGKGTRIASVNSEIPKPMIPIDDKPILEYEIECLRNQGCKDIVLVVGHLGHIIQEYFGDGSGISPATGRAFDVNITYIIEDRPLGTAGALYLLKEQLTDDFLLLNGDIIFDIDIDRFYQAHKKNGGIATLFTHPNNHPYDSAIIVADDQKCVTDWLHKEDPRSWYKNRVNAGIHMISLRIFDCDIDFFRQLQKVDLDRDILKPLIKTGALYVYDSPEYVKDMGTPERFCSVAEDIRSGRTSSRNLANRQRAVFLDRDGTINKYIGFLSNIDQFELLNGAASAIRKINESGYLAIVITNQPVVARGEVTYDELFAIHNKMETLLGQDGAFLDAIYFCPHHPHSGYEGEVSSLKFNCTCRKPKIGMFQEAAEDFNIDLKASWMIGDGSNDIQAGRAAGCRTALIGTAESGIKPDLCVDSLLQFTNSVFK